MDRGASWASFETSLPPSIGSNTMSFHSTNWNWILFTGSNCESLGGWKGRVCSDEVGYFFLSFIVLETLKRVLGGRIKLN